MGGESIRMEEKKLVLECKTLDEFGLRYIQDFGFPSRASRINGIWTDRKKYRDELSPILKNLPGGGTVIEPRAEKERKSDYDEGELLYRLTVLFAEHLQVKLFKKLDKTGVKDGTTDSQESGTGHS